MNASSEYFTTLLVGNIGAGKTTLRQQLLGEDVDYAKTQTTIVDSWLVDSPGEYLEHGRMRFALQLVSYDVEKVLLVVDGSDDQIRMPPGISTFFNKPTLGVVTHVDLASDSQIEAAKARLQQAGAEQIFEVDALHGTGVAEIRNALKRKPDDLATGMRL